jgi:flagellar hook assembly protein FlgD
MRYTLPANSVVKITVYDVLGRAVETMINSEQRAGYHEVQWMPKGASGVYIYRLEAIAVEGDGKPFIAVKKMLFMK